MMTDSSLKSRRRIGGRVQGAKVPFKEIHVAHNLRDLGRERVALTESRSEASEKILPEGIKLENTYRLGPDDGKKFLSHVVEAKMKDILKEQIGEMNYRDAMSSNLPTDLATQIKKELHHYQWNRYKYVVQVMIGQNREQDVKIGSRCLWNQTTDNFACASYSNKTMFAVAACFAVYFD